MVKKFGVKPLLEVGQGLNPSEVAGGKKIGEDDIVNINRYYETLLTKDKDYPRKASDADISELLDCLMPENPVERNMYRREVNTSNTNKFVRIDKGEKGQAAKEKSSTENDSKTVGFKHVRYEVSESNEFVSIYVEKRCSEACTFTLRTKDCTATAGEDYEAIDEVITMEASEKERIINIKVHDDPNWEPDEEFKVELLDKEGRRRLTGSDTLCSVLIIDEDKPGQIGFSETSYDISRLESKYVIYLQRVGGSDGEISCTLKTMSN